MSVPTAHIPTVIRLLVTCDARMANAVACGNFADVELAAEQREEVAMELYRERRRNWTPALRPKYPNGVAA